MDAINGTWGSKEAAEYLGCKPGTLRRWASQKKVPHIKVGYLTRYRKADLDEYLDRNCVAAIPHG